jgi:hypothetical protein
MIRVSDGLSQADTGFAPKSMSNTMVSSSILDISTIWWYDINGEGDGDDPSDYKLNILVYYTSHYSFISFIHNFLPLSHIVSITAEDSWAIIQCPLSYSLCHRVILPLHWRSKAIVKSDSIEDSGLYTCFRDDITTNADWWGCETIAEEFRRWWCDETEETKEESWCLLQPTHRNLLRFYTAISIYLSTYLSIYKSTHLFI